MRKFLISAAVTAAALTAAAPAAAQYAPPLYGNAYGQGYNNYGQVRSLQARINNAQRQIQQLDRRNMISNREARDLMSDARAVERRLYETSRGGLSYGETRAVEQRVARIEQRLSRVAYNRYGANGYRDRDHDGRNDRWEDDQGYRHDR
jgi:uncharacterized sporulation protein YeaH/YhbH (DUF444 family)